MKISLAMGFFDSVHIGHRQLLKLSRDFALASGMTPAVHTFDNDIGASIGGKQLYDFADRAGLLKRAGADVIVTDTFDEKLKNTSGKEFLDSLTSRYDIGAFFCGYDYRFGKNAECDAAYLASYAKNKGIKCEILPPQILDGKKISTTRIKTLLLGGEIQKANELLVDPYFVRGEVVHGRGEGAKFGFPTANILRDGVALKLGVYKTTVKFDQKSYMGVTNVGAKPTFMDQTISIETMIVGFDGDLYGKEITVQFDRYIRPIKKFDDANQLKLQIQKDVKEALC